MVFNGFKFPTFPSWVQVSNRAVKPSDSKRKPGTAIENVTHEEGGTGSTSQTKEGLDGDLKLEAEAAEPDTNEGTHGNSPGHCFNLGLINGTTSLKTTEKPSTCQSFDGRTLATVSTEVHENTAHRKNLPTEATNLEVEVQVRPKKKLQPKSINEEAVDHLRMELAKYLKKEHSKKDTRKKSNKEKRYELKKFLKKSLKAYLEANEHQNPEEHILLEKRVGNMLDKAEFSCTKTNGKTKESKKKDSKRRTGHGKSNKKAKYDGENRDSAEEYPDDEILGGLQREGSVEPIVAQPFSITMSLEPKLSGLESLIESEFNRLDLLSKDMVEESTRLREAAIEREFEMKEASKVEALEREALERAALERQNAIYQEHLKEVAKREAKIEAARLEKLRKEEEEAKAREAREAEEARIRLLAAESKKRREQATRRTEEKAQNNSRDEVPGISSPAAILSRKQQELQEEINNELATLQELQDEFVHKVYMAKHSRSSILDSALFSQSILKNVPLKSPESMEQDDQIQMELARLRSEQAALFRHGRDLTNRHRQVD